MGAKRSVTTTGPQAAAGRTQRARVRKGIRSLANALYQGVVQRAGTYTGGGSMMRRMDGIWAPCPLTPWSVAYVQHVRGEDPTQMAVTPQGSIYNT